MALQNVTAKTKDGKVYSAEYDFGDNLADAGAKFGEEVVFTNFRKSSTVDLQAHLRRGGDAATWKPGIRTVAVAAAPTMEGMRKYYASLTTDEEKKAFLKDVRSGVS